MEQYYAVNVSTQQVIGFTDMQEAVAVLGTQDRNLKLIEPHFNVKVVCRGSDLVLQGEPGEVERASRVVEGLREAARSGVNVGEQEVRSVINEVKKNGSRVQEMFSQGVVVSRRRQPVRPKTARQGTYLEAIQSHSIVFATGPAGTGKTYLAMACAVAALERQEFDRIILARPAVEAGESLGFLPGDYLEKVNPYFRPLYDALHDLLPAERARRMIEQGTIEVAPLAYMRGRTLNHSFVILDEGQNTTPKQMKMFLTRLGYNAQAVVTGDVTQTDLPPGTQSGLVHACEVLRDVDGIAIIEFEAEDVVRHPMVQDIVDAYEREHKDQTPPSGAGELA